MPKFLRIGVHQLECLRIHVEGMVRSTGWLDGFPRVGCRGGPRRRRRATGLAGCFHRGPTRCGTVERAKGYAKTAIARRRNHRYELLAGKIAIRRRTAERSAEFEQALATILYVDIVNGLPKAARLGDSRWTKGETNDHYAAVRRELKALHGKEIMTTGHGCAARCSRHGGCRGPLRDRDPRSGAHAGARDQGGAARGRIQGERSRGVRSRVSHRRARLR